MKVKELKKILESIPDNYEVKISKERLERVSAIEDYQTVYLSGTDYRFEGDDGYFTYRDLI